MISHVAIMIYQARNLIGTFHPFYVISCVLMETLISLTFLWLFLPPYV